MPIMPVTPIKNNLKLFGKYLDQTALVEKLYNVMPPVLTGIAAGYGIYDTLQVPKENRKKQAIKNASVLGFTVASALIATRGLKIKGKQLFEGIIELPEKDSEGLIEALSKPVSQKAKMLIKKCDIENTIQQLRLEQVDIKRTIGFTSGN